MNELQHKQQKHPSRTRLLIGSSLLLLAVVIMVFWALNTYPCSRASTCESSAILILTGVLSFILGCMGWSLLLAEVRKSSVAFRVVVFSVVLLGGLAWVEINVIHPGLTSQLILHTMGSPVGYTLNWVITLVILGPFVMLSLFWPVIRRIPQLWRRLADPKN